jgi:hypothetical protein
VFDYDSREKKVVYRYDGNWILFFSIQNELLARQLKYLKVYFYSVLYRNFSLQATRVESVLWHACSGSELFPEILVKLDEDSMHMTACKTQTTEVEVPSLHGPPVHNKPHLRFQFLDVFLNKHHETGNMRQTSCVPSEQDRDVTGQQLTKPERCTLWCTPTFRRYISCHIMQVILELT